MYLQCDPRIGYSSGPKERGRTGWRAVPQPRTAVERRSSGHRFGILTFHPKSVSSYGNLRSSLFHPGMSFTIGTWRRRADAGSAVKRIHGGTLCWSVEWQDVSGLPQTKKQQGYFSSSRRRVLGDGYSVSLIS